MVTKVDKSGNLVLELCNGIFIFRPPAGKDMVHLQRVYREDMVSFELMAEAISLLCVSHDMSPEDVLNESAEFFMTVGAQLLECFPVLGNNM
jgi:hypothetical protein